MGFDNKQWWKSKTLIINGLVILAGLATALSGELVAGSALTLTSVVNLVLRVITNTEIKW